MPWSRFRLARIVLGILACWSILVVAAEPDYPLSIAVTDTGVIYLADRNLPGVWKLEGEKLSLFFEGSRKFRTPLNAIRCVAVDREGKLFVGDSATRDVYRFDESGKPVGLTQKPASTGPAPAAGPPGTPKSEPKKDAPKKEDLKKEEGKTDEAKKAEPKKEEAKKEEPKKVDDKKDEAKKEEAKKEEPKKDGGSGSCDPKEDDKKTDDKKLDDKKSDNKKTSDKKVDDKKTDDKKTDDKKTDDKKTDDKKVSSEKSENANKSTAPVSATPGVPRPTAPRSTFVFGEIGIPMDIAVDKAGDLFVSDLEIHRIVKVSKNGGAAHEFVKIQAPRGLCLDNEENLWVVSGRKLVKVSPAGEKKTIVEDGTFGFPHTVAVAADKTAYVCDGYEKCIWKVPPGGKPEKLVSGEPLMNPVGMRLVADKLYVVDPRVKAVFQITLDGKLTKLPMKP